MENILVSIHCTTYNHEKYIADAIDSFLHNKQILSMKYSFTMMPQQIEQQT